MTQVSYRLDLRDLMDAHYGVGCWTQRSAPGVGSDIGPALADGIATLRATFGRGDILIPPGSWLAKSMPDFSGIRVIGAGSMASVITYDNATGVAFRFSGANGFTGGGISGIGLLLEQGLGDTNAYGILLAGNAIYQPSQNTFDDIYMSAIGGSSFWWDGFHVDGTARVPPAAIGCRVATLTNVQVFNCHNINFYLSGVEQYTMINIGAYTSKGPYANVLMIAGSALVPSNHVYGVGINASGGVNLSNSADVMINGVRLAA